MCVFKGFIFIDCCEMKLCFTLKRAVNVPLVALLFLVIRRANTVSWGSCVLPSVSIHLQTPSLSPLQKNVFECNYLVSKLLVFTVLDGFVLRHKHMTPSYLPNYLTTPTHLPIHLPTEQLTINQVTQPTYLTICLPTQLSAYLLTCMPTHPSVYITTD